MEPEDSADAVRMFAVYERPADYPSGWVVREWLLGAGEAQPGDARRADSLEDAHRLLPRDVTRVDWPGEPDPHIVETWL